MYNVLSERENTFTVQYLLHGDIYIKKKSTWEWLVYIKLEKDVRRLDNNLIYLSLEKGLGLKEGEKGTSLY